MSNNSSIVRCCLCGRPITQARLDALPGVTTCVACAAKNPPRMVQANELDLSQASPIDRTGFAPSD
jgi:RNA polymerase-binding transcription factor DksA